MKSKVLEMDMVEYLPIPYIFGELEKSIGGIEFFLVKGINDVYTDKFNIEESEIVDKDISEILELNNYEEFLKCIKEEKSKQIEFKEFNVGYELIPKKVSENEYVIWFIDITKELNYEESNKIKSEFFANLSHELRTPLNLIFSSLQILELKIKNANFKEEKSISKYLNMANQNTYRLLKLVNNIIDSNKITSGYFDYSPQNYDIICFIEGICQSVVDFAKQKNIDVIFDTYIEEKVVCFDLDKMERIILNILSNAIKFSKDGGVIKIDIEENDDNIEIKISDNGIGIPKNKLNSIFDRFKQVDGNTIRKGEGSGIGLYLVKCLVDMHGGSIFVDSEVGIGTIFNIQIPNKIIDECECTITEKNLQNSYIEKIKVEFSDIYA
ncbi:sensor histidine kinase [Paraclostridium sordellii]|uniref:sensor histidine kinase n=1 Tax=Paraclostridium sordellii TaxID=1505 RepID=UPI000541F7F6|nr:HAMP domain-containing sensor histidine kinase [Paeniclostridium sordellii]CEK34922.1 sensory transduction histidine kinase,Sensor histidine kinase YycG,two component system sensor kinase SsrA,Predicted periplasmic ligand-binding sensor domain,phosphate regulon sensor kinase PhoR,Histidine kinase-, DNA gyrase B-, and HSP90-like ATPase [[Clostridium] sordellii] [Paeniclostridium sordellii]CEN92650.1 sensory transduction histidine kinase [[Clostridium] sordellii] [Paeniclostridium sordellii]CEN